MYNIFCLSFIELSRLFLRLTVVVQQDVLWFEVSVRWENKEQSRWDGKKQSDDEIKRLGELKLTCRRCVLGAGPPARSRSLRSRRRLSSRRSPRRPCDRCETSGLLRSSASTRGTERPSSRRRTLNSPGDRSGVTLREVTRKTRECETADATRTCRDSHHKSAVDFLQDLFLVERHRLSFPLLYPLLLQLLTGVHLPRGPYLTRTHLQGEERVDISFVLFQICSLCCDFSVRAGGTWTRKWSPVVRNIIFETVSILSFLQHWYQTCFLTVWIIFIYFWGSNGF